MTRGHSGGRTICSEGAQLQLACISATYSSGQAARYLTAALGQPELNTGNRMTLTIQVTPKKVVPIRLK